MKRKLCFFLFTAIYAISIFAMPGNGIVYVRPAADGGFDLNSGESWDDAKETLAAALEVAKGTVALEYADAKDIYIQGGTYLLSTYVNFSAQNYSGIRIYGSFSGYDPEETPETRSKLPGSKPWEFENQTILDGNSCSTDLIRGGGAGKFVPSIFDGISFENGGMTNGGAEGKDNFAALYVRDGMNFINCSFKNNKGGNNGGAVSMYDGLKADASPVGVLFSHCYFYNNSAAAGKQGGALQANMYPGDDLQILDCVFEKNTLNGKGGAVYSLPGNKPKRHVIDRCMFIDNESTSDDGGAVYWGYGQVMNSAFYGNKVSNGKQGAAIYMGRSNDLVANCIVYNNAAATASVVAMTGGGNVYNTTIANNLCGNAINCYQAASKVINTVVWNNKQSDGKDAGIFSNAAITVKNSACSTALSEEFVLINNVDVAGAPLFVAPTDFVGLASGPSQLNQLTDCDWTPKETSALIGAGDAMAFRMAALELYETDDTTPDYLGNARYSNEGTKINIGAIENGAKLPTALIESRVQDITIFVSDKTINIKGIETNALIYIFDTMGNNIYAISVHEDDFSLDLQSGIYIVKVVTPQNSQSAKVAIF